MFSLFSSIAPISNGILKIPQWSLISTGVNRNIDKVKSYYRELPNTVRSDHILAKILIDLAIPVETSLSKYFDSVQDVSMKTAMAVGLTCGVSSGRAFHGVFYDENSTEFIIGTADYHDYEDTHKNWKNISAVEVLMHPKSDMNLFLPEGKNYSDESGLCVILVDIPKLAVQYRAFCLEQEKTNVATPSTIYQFIGAYVLPNMVAKQTDICLFNRIYNRIHRDDYPDSRIRGRHPFVMPGYLDYMDRAIDDLIRILDITIDRFSVVLQTIPAFSTTNMYEAMLIPDLVPNRQMDWILTGCRLKVIDFLISVCKFDKSEAINKNGPALYQMLREYRHNSVGSELERRLPRYIWLDLRGYLDRLFNSVDADAYLS